ncbi:MAG: hypothetical protein COB14_03400 [Alphaproteobacteria bacterium]|nr:MAG: hypothetical protein COB14_03400 [Alphaproteobacteria bacterium]
METSVLSIETSAQTQKNTLYRVKNERTAGFIPSWDAPKDTNIQGGTRALSSYAPQTNNDIKPVMVTQQEDAFSFWDLLDMVNPLQHIPVVSFAYREITGDEIKPVSQIIGGGVFGGPAGLAGGLVNVVVREETGRDVMGNVLALVGLGGDLPQKVDLYALDAEYTAYDDLPVALLSFAQMPINSVTAQNNGSSAQKQDYERMQIASGRSAGTIAVYS